MPVGMIVGGWFASSAVSNVITYLMSYAKDQYKWQLGLKAKSKRLEQALPQIKALLETVDSGDHIKEKNTALEEWLWQFRDAVDEAEDFKDEVEYQRLEKEIEGKKSKVSDATSSVNTFFKWAVHKDPTLKRLKEVVKGLDRLVTEMGPFLNLVATSKDKQPLNTSSRNTTSLLPVFHKLVGRDDEKQMIISKLLNSSSASDSRNFSILPIVGVGGIGKTTLAQLVYNDENIEKHFNTRVWVCVSNTFDVPLLTRRILELVVNEKQTTDNLQFLQQELLKNLRSKKVLLVLDDVWNDQNSKSWDDLLKPFSSVERGSMILLTTRMENVAKMMTGAMEPIFLKRLNKEDYWEFFKDCAFGGVDPNDHKKLKDIGSRIAKKLKGSPLAAKTVGWILKTNLNDEHWERILNSEIWKLDQGENDIMPALRLSYQHLPSHLKPCFRFCSIFPQDYEFDKEKLVYMWMALGLLQEPKNGNERPEDIGDDYMNDLVGKSFFDCQKYGFSGTYYVMHDLLHDLATSVSVGECFRIGEITQTTLIPNTIRHLSINTSLTPPILHEIAKLKHLRTLLLPKGFNPIFIDFPKELKGLRALRILESSAFCITDDSISNLKLLRYLHSHHRINNQVPESVNKLYHLRFLHYQNDSPFLERELLPLDCIQNLINLRRLTTPNSESGKFSGLGRLSSLQILKKFSVEDNGKNMLDLKNLGELRELGIKNLEKVKRTDDVVEANLKDKQHLRTLTLEWDSDCSSGCPEVDEQVLDALEPHSNLQNLNIKCYMGCRSPHWITLQSLSNIVSITLCNCEGWKDLPPLGQLPYLEFLRLERMISVKRVGSAPDGGTEASIFPSLLELSLGELPALQEFYGGAEKAQWLPRLESLEISKCPNLSVFPNLPCGLRKLRIEVVNWTALPKLWLGGNTNALSMSSPLSSSSWSTSSLSLLHIRHCEGLESLADGLLLQTELFTSLEKVSIIDCGKLTHLPIGQFDKFPSLKDLEVWGCPKLQRRSTSGRFFPPSLQSLFIQDWDFQDLEDFNLLHFLGLWGWANIKSLPSAEVFGRWKALKYLRIRDCSELESLGGLQALSSLEELWVERCPKLVTSASTSPSALLVEEPRSSPSSSSSSLIVKHLFIDDLFLLCIGPLKYISLQILVIFETQVVHIESCDEVRYSSALKEWVLNNRTSLESIYCDRYSRLFSLVDLQSLPSLQYLSIHRYRNLQSLPELPSSLETLTLYGCSSELEERCLQDSGPDWPKIQHIPNVTIGRYDKEDLATFTVAKHRGQPQLEET
ncbi:putative disease resistance protein RGA3 isoform X2 [Typha angustifolia]|uniref:putative disease resistance protein RGA3 isoform X2 n=1 Tax=Typha angustifolia TaxID=59011 RepID=UPI003C2B1493